MVTSKYRTRPSASDEMVKRALDWIDISLVYDIPVMTEYSAFSRALLTAAVAPDDDATIGDDTPIEITGHGGPVDAVPA